MSMDYRHRIEHWAPQPDGRIHLLSGHHGYAACRIRLTRYNLHFGPAESYLERADLCQQCRAIFKERATFPKPATEEQKDVIVRIQKLLALAESPNESEAALAAARANELLEKHNLSLHVVEDTNQQRAEKRVTDRSGLAYSRTNSYSLGLLRHVRCCVL